MNERIKELAKQANITIVPEPFDDASRAWNENMKKFVPEPFDDASRAWNENMKKFTQLIVRECMNIARTVGNISEPDDWALDRCYEIEQRIQDRFGVEE
jgi:hypothetical protein